ncbi:hypothetical protein [Streptomyces lutosisoli]|uniref:Uncharacterized protein n=1 Tax=Streptomyces lutosisoli TaxID=2665721 RepID=A0ABW2VWQ9_9ACTN
MKTTPEPNRLQDLDPSETPELVQLRGRLLRNAACSSDLERQLLAWGLDEALLVLHALNPELAETVARCLRDPELPAMVADLARFEAAEAGIDTSTWTERHAAETPEPGEKPR